MNEPQSLELSLLISRALEGALSEEEYRLLNERMADPEAQRQYFELLKVDLALRDVSTHELEMEEDCDLVLDPQFWCQLARAEQNAPAVQPVPAEKSARVEKVHYEETVRRVNKTSLFVAIGALAALLFLLIYINANPAGRIRAATVIDTYYAQWASEALTAGSRVDLSADTRILLSGVVKMETEEGVGVVIEGPAEFRFSGASTMELNYGRLFARVDPSGIGFTVSTPVSRVIDLGTAFGVRADLGGNTELHVFEGKTSLSLKDRAASEATNQIVTQGQAKHIGGRDSTIREIALELETFIEDIDSQHQWVFRGQKEISLADMVGGGNGLGNGQRNKGIDPVSGALSTCREMNRWVDNRFVPVTQYPFVDGVFVPNGAKPQVVSSRGHVFRECPVTQGNFYTEVLDTPAAIDRAPVRLMGVEYGERGERCVFLHANLGITYDLDQIRRVLSLSGQRFEKFRTWAGISETAWRECNADLWVLVDGKVRYSQRGVREKGFTEYVEIELSEKDRFLTLAATDGGDPDSDASVDPPVLGIDSDWCLFSEPVLVLE